MKKEEIKQASDELFESLNTVSTVEPLTDRFVDMTKKEAYEVSLLMLEKRISRGEKLIGKKIGVTSPAVQNMLNVHEPDFGFLTDRMLCEGTAKISDSLIQPKAEGEIAFLLKSSLMGPGITNEDVLSATEAVMPCFEIVDSRVRDWKIKIEDTIADNASCGLFAVNREASIDPKQVDLVNCKMIVKKNGTLLSEGTGAAALGNPLNCVAWLANTLSEFGVSLNAGDIILSGSLVPLEPVTAGDVMSVDISGIGSLSITFI